MVVICHDRHGMQNPVTKLRRFEKLPKQRLGLRLREIDGRPLHETPSAVPQAGPTRFPRLARPIMFDARSSSRIAMPTIADASDRPARIPRQPSSVGRICQQPRKHGRIVLTPRSPAKNLLIAPLPPPIPSRKHKRRAGSVSARRTNRSASTSTPLPTTPSLDPQAPLAQQSADSFHPKERPAPLQEKLAARPRHPEVRGAQHAKYSRRLWDSQNPHWAKVKLHRLAKGRAVISTIQGQT